MNEFDPGAGIIVDAADFSEAMRAATAIAQAAAAQISASLESASRNGAARFRDLSEAASGSAAAVRTSFQRMAEAGTESGRAMAESMASAFAPVTEAGGRMLAAWVRGGRDLQREFASIVQGMIREAAAGALQNALFGARAGSPFGAIFGTRGAGGGLLRLAGDGVDASGLGRALDAAWRSISGTVGEVFRSAFRALGGLFGPLLSAIGIGGNGGGGAASAATEAAATAAHTAALSANTAAIGVLSAAVAANTIAVEQLAIATQIDTTSHLFGFESGGIVPSAAGGMVLGGSATFAILHPREMVLPAPLSEGIQSAIGGGRFGQTSGGDVHVHIGSIQGAAGVDLRRELERFADRIGDIVRDQHRANRFLATRY